MRCQMFVASAAAAVAAAVFAAANTLLSPLLSFSLCLLVTAVFHSRLKSTYLQQYPIVNTAVHIPPRGEPYHTLSLHVRQVKRNKSTRRLIGPLLHRKLLCTPTSLGSSTAAAGDTTRQITWRQHCCLSSHRGWCVPLNSMRAIGVRAAAVMESISNSLAYDYYGTSKPRFFRFSDNQPITLFFDTTEVLR